MLVTEDGITTSSSEVHTVNAAVPMLVTELGIVTELKAGQP
jgi:hypothetical protein